MKICPFDFWGIEKYEMKKFFQMEKNFTVHLKHINNYDFSKISKTQNITATGIFSRTSFWGLAQKRLILMEWITNNIFKIISFEMQEQNVKCLSYS